MQNSDIVIVGGGISGLSLAFYCARAGLETTVLEKEDRFGGCFHSHRIRDGNSEFWLELGAHTCYNSYGNLLGIIDACGLAGKMIKREKAPYRMLIDNDVKSIFSQINLPELLVSLPRLFTQEKTGETVSSYYSRILGENNYRKTFRHFFNAVPSQEADDFPAELLFKRRDRRKDVLKSFTFGGGLQTITDAIPGSCNMRVLTGKQVDRIELQEGRYCVVTVDGSEYGASNLGLAAPVHIAAKLIQAVHPEVTEHLFQILPARINTTGVILQKRYTQHEPVAGIISPDDLFYSVVSRDIVPDDQYRGFTFHFKADVQDEGVKRERIAAVLGVDPSRIEHCVSKLNLLPAPRTGHNRLVEKIDSLIEDTRLLLTGNYFAGISIEDCVSRSLREFSRLDLAGKGSTGKKYGTNEPV